MNREEWLSRCLESLTPWLEAAGRPVQNPVRVTCGWPAARALSPRSRRVGECWSPATSADGTAEIFVSPVLDDPAQVAGTVAHELIHASGIHGHRSNFARLARALDLEGPPTCTGAGEAFKRRAAPILEALGPYPHARIVARNSGATAQSTRLLKVVCVACEDEGQPYIVRMSRRTLEELGAPLCPTHTEPMEEA